MQQKPKPAVIEQRTLASSLSLGESLPQSLLNAPAQLLVSVVAMGQVGRTWPAWILEFHVANNAGSCITRQDVEVHVAIDHHQHEIIDLVIGKTRAEMAFYGGCYRF
jgi:hypothetical protein